MKAWRPCLLALALLWAGCFAPPRPLEPPADPRAPTTLVSAAHYRAFASPAALAAYLRPETGPLVSAHRGGPGPFLPENAIETFEHALLHAPALIECDLRLTADGRIVLLHDETLDRTTDGLGPVGARTLAEIRRLRLRDPLGRITPYRVPTLDEALAWAEGRAVLVLDRKPDVPPDAVVAAVRRSGAEGRVILITYDTEQLEAYLTRAPDLVYSVATATLAQAEEALALHDPDFLIGWGGVRAPDPAVAERLRAAGVMLQVGTFGAVDAAARAGDPSGFVRYLAEGADVLATDAVVPAAQVVRAARR